MSEVRGTPRCLVLVRAGDNSVHESWLEPAADKAFDLAVSYYGTTPGRWAPRADHYHVQAGAKLPCVADWLDDNWSWVRAYDFVAIPDDDLSASAGVWSEVFAAMARHRLDLAQPSFAVDSHWCHPITARRPGSSLRVTNFVENGLAVFSRRALEWCAATLRLGSSGVGSDYAWAAIVRGNGGRVGIVDEVQVEHVRAHHGAGASAHQSADSLASVLTHPELYDELLLMAAFGIGNPYDPFVEDTVGVDGSAPARYRDAVPGAGGVDPGPVSFVVVGSGTLAELRATLGSVLACARPDDEIVLVDATFASYLGGCLGDGASAVTLVAAPDRGLAECYDLAFARATRATVVMVASGWSLGPAFRQRLAAAAAGGPTDLVLDPGAPVAAVRRELVAALGGMGTLSRAVTTGFGKVGTGELLEVARHRLDEAGRRVALCSLDASVAPPASRDGAPEDACPAGEELHPFTRRLHPALVRALGPGAPDAVVALGPLVAADQRDQYARLMASTWPRLAGLTAGAPASWPPDVVRRVEAGPYRVPALVRALVRRGNVAQAATLLATHGLPAATSPAEVDEAVAVLTAAGRDPDELLGRRRHALDATPRPLARPGALVPGGLVPGAAGALVAGASEGEP